MAKDRTVPCLHDAGSDQLVFQTLVIALGVIVTHVFGNGAP